MLNRIVWLGLASAVLAACSSAPKPDADPQLSDVSCVKETTVSSSIPKTICRSKADKDEARTAAQSALSNTRGRIPTTKDN